MRTDSLTNPRGESLSERIHQAQISLESRPDATAVFDRATTAFMRALLSQSRQADQEIVPHRAVPEW